MSIIRLHALNAIKRFMLPVAVVLVAAVGFHQEAKAQYASRWIAIGSMHTQWSQIGMFSPQNFPYDSPPLWDGIQKQAGWGYRMSTDFWVKNLKDLSGNPGPTHLEVNFRGTDRQRFWPRPPFKLISKRPKPIVTVNGLPTFQRNQSLDEIDPSLGAERVFVGGYGTWMGIDVQTKVYVSSSEPHDDYYLVELTYTNTGNTDQDEEIEEKRTLKDVYVGRQRSMAVARLGGTATWSGYKWGGGTDSDRTLEDDPHYDVDFTSVYGWSGPQNEFTQWDTKGIPMMKQTKSAIPDWDHVGRLAAGGMIGLVDIYAPKRAMKPNETPRDVPAAGASQPSSLRHQLNAIPGNENAPWDSWKAFTDAKPIPYGWWHAERECPKEDFPEAQNWEQRMAQCQTNEIVRWGSRPRMGYGPYTLKPGEHFTIVQAFAISGLTQDAKFAIGRKYKANWSNFKAEDTPIDYDANGDGEITDTAVDGAEGDEHMSKNMWVMSTRDSLFQTFRRARAAWKKGNSPQAVPQRPVHPASFSVDTRADKIQLGWSLYDDAPVPDSFAVYRTDVSYRLPHEHIATVKAKAGKRDYSYADTGVERGVGYYYYLQAIDQTEKSPAGVIPVGTTLRSNRHITQTYSPAELVSNPGGNLSDTRVVPNPLNVNASESVRFPGQNGNKIGFLDVPGLATIEVYTELGELVRTINHTSGSGDEYWNLTTESNQVVQSGIYLAVIKDRETGKQVIRRFVIMR